LIAATSGKRQQGLSLPPWLMHGKRQQHVALDAPPVDRPGFVAPR
jgi:hypothetical protein